MTKIITFRGQMYRFLNDKENTDFYLKKIQNYESECGCLHGAILTVLGAVTFILYTLAFDWTSGSVMVHGLSGVLFIFLAAGVGKVIGIGLARLRLQLLYRFLIQHKYLQLNS
jgi:hypothetical protein